VTKKRERSEPSVQVRSCVLPGLDDVVMVLKSFISIQTYLD